MEVIPNTQDEHEESELEEETDEAVQNEVDGRSMIGCLLYCRLIHTPAA